MISSIVRGAAALLLVSAVTPAAAQYETESRVLPLQEPAPTPAALTPAAAHPFAAMAGSWSGGGVMAMTGEIRENIRCRASYNYGAPASSLALTIRCASDNYKFELSSNVVERGGSISGRWSEAVYGVSGSISGRVAGGRVTAMARGDSFNAALAVNTTGNSQTVSITPEATYIISVNISLSRSGASR